MQMVNGERARHTHRDDQSGEVAGCGARNISQVQLIDASSGSKLTPE